MKWFISLWLLVGVALGLGPSSSPARAVVPAGGAQGAPAVIARLHHIGVDQLSHETNGTVFKEICKLPATTRLRADTLNKLAEALAKSFQAKASQSSGTCAPLLRPLLEDLCTAEAYIEILEPAPGQVESTMAARVDPGRVRIWQANLAQLTSAWQPRQGALSFTTSHSWVAVHLDPSSNRGSEGMNAADSAYGRVLRGEAPIAASDEHWLTFEGDLTRWTGWFSGPMRKSLPKFELTVSGHKEYLRSQARLTFTEPLRSHFEAWEIPVGTLRDPLISFTAVQGLGPWLESQPWFKELGLGAAPDQLYVWGLSQTAFQIQAAVPVADANHAFAAVLDKWVPQWNQVLATNAVGQFRRQTNRTEIAWRGLPILVPYINPVRDNGHDFLHAGIFPVNPPSDPAPPALFQQLTSQNKLLYYDWEITQARLDQLRPLLQLAAVFLTISPMSTNSSVYQWLDVAGPKLGNSATEITMASSRELNLVRTSHLGFSGAELLTLANWLEGTNFPRLNVDVHFRPVVRSSRQKASR